MNDLLKDINIHNNSELLKDIKVHNKNPLIINIKHLYVGCIPVHASPEHPIDQTNCIQEHCRHCNELMWVSEKKRNLRAKKPKKVQIYCLECLAFAAVYHGYSPILASL